MSFTYIASPYSHKDQAMRNARFDIVSAFTAEMVKDGKVVYSPIAHSHPLAVKYDIRGDFDFWKVQNMGMLSAASSMIVLRMTGWRESEGVQAEIKYADDNAIPIVYI